MQSRNSDSQPATVDQPQQEKGWSADWLQLLPTSSTLADAATPQYTLKLNRYLFGGILGYQNCYTDQEVKLLEQIGAKYKTLSVDDQYVKYFDLADEWRWFGLWKCTTPTHMQAFQDSYIFPKSKMNVRDPVLFPLEKLGGNVAGLIGNWQQQRNKNQNLDLMNDPTAIVFNQLEDWFRTPFTKLECTKESVDELVKFLSIITYVVDSIPDFGPDRANTDSLQDKLDQARNILLNCMTNKQLPVLLSEMIIEGESLEKLIGTYLHFLVNQEVSNNYLDDFLNGNSEHCKQSPICQIFSNANKITSNTDLIPEIKSYQQENRLYLFQSVDTEKNSIQIQYKDNLLNDIKFPTCVPKREQYQQNYLDAVATLESMKNVRETFEQLKSLQSSLGKYSIAIDCSEQINELANLNMQLIDRAHSLVNQLWISAIEGHKQNLKSPSKENAYFEKNKSTLDKRIGTDSTPIIQLEQEFSNQKERIKKYLDELNKLKTDVKTGEAARTVQKELSNLIADINRSKTFLPAQLNKENVLQIASEKPLAIDNGSPTTNQQINNHEENLTPTTVVPAKDHLELKLESKTKDPLTNKTIYNFKGFRGEKDVGGFSLYDKPYLCASEDKTATNIMWPTGEFKNVLEDISITEVCEHLPPSVFDRVIFSAASGAGHGFLRGSTNVVGITLNAKGLSSNVSKLCSESLYYGSTFLMNFYWYYQQLKEEDSTIAAWNAAQQAAFDTGKLACINMFLSFGSSLLNQASEILKKKQHDTWSTMTRWFAKALPFTMYPLNAYQQGFSGATSAFAAGAATQKVTEKVGKFIVRRK